MATDRPIDFFQIYRIRVFDLFSALTARAMFVSTSVYATANTAYTIQATGAGLEGNLRKIWEQPM
jgi:hypothetical protein